MFNLALSVVFVVKMGIAGVFLGTTVSTVLVPLIGEVYVLYKYGFSMKPVKFYKEMLTYVSISIMCVSLCFLITRSVKISLVGVVVRCVSSFLASNAILLLMCSGSEYFQDASNLLKGFLVKGRASNI